MQNCLEDPVRTASKMVCKSIDQHTDQGAEIGDERNVPAAVIRTKIIVPADQRINYWLGRGALQAIGQEITAAARLAANQKISDSHAARSVEEKAATHRLQTNSHTARSVEDKAATCKLHADSHAAKSVEEKAVTKKLRQKTWMHRCA